MNSWTVAVVFYGVKFIYLLMAIQAVLFVIFHYKNGGLNNQFRKLHTKRYVLYNVIFICCAISQSLDFANKTGTITLSPWFKNFLIAYFLIAPLLYLLVRITEPAVWNHTKKRCKRTSGCTRCCCCCCFYCCCCCLCRKRKSYADPLDDG